MPTYEYRCKLCNTEHEIFHSIAVEPMKECPACKKEGLEKMVSAGAGIIFKGSGFYETDYKRVKKDESAGKEAPKESSHSCGSGCGCGK